jgi:uncharacterized Zn-binding protein involved in type VI secretion
MPFAARVTDLHSCPKNPASPVLPPGEPTVLICFMPAARLGDPVACSTPEFIASGEDTVLIGGKPAARMGDLTGGPNVCPGAGPGVITTGCPTVLIGKSYHANVLCKASETGAPFCEIADAGLGKNGSKRLDANEIFYKENLRKLIDKEVKGENSEKLADAMRTLWDNRSNTQQNAQIDNALKTVSEERGVPLDKIKQDWGRYQGLLEEQDQIGTANGNEQVPPLNEFFHSDFMASTSQLRYGQVAGDALDVDPVFGALLNPTGGLVGPGNKSIDSNDSPVGYHGAVHDAAGYLRNYHNLGPGYDYLGTDNRDTTSPLSGQRNGIEFWNDELSSSRSFPKRAWDGTQEYIMKGTVGGIDGASKAYNTAKDATSDAYEATKEALSNAYSSANDAMSDAWDDLF